MTEEWLAAYNASISWDDNPTTSSLDSDNSHDVTYWSQEGLEYWDSVSQLLKMKKNIFILNFSFHFIGGIN